MLLTRFAVLLLLATTTSGCSKSDSTDVQTQAEAGNPVAQLLMAQELIEAGETLEAVGWLRRAAEQEDARARFNLGVMYANGVGLPENDAEAVKWFRLAAEQGLAVAQLNLGVMYDQGDGVSENDAEAVKWFRLAAEQGLASAQFNLGVMYANGNGVPENDVEAVKWFRLAAEQGEAKAQFNLGVMYASDSGVPGNNAEAYFWFSLAAAAGMENARRLRDDVRDDLTRQAVMDVQARTAAWRPKQWTGINLSDGKVRQALAVLESERR